MKILILDKHQIFRDGLRATLKKIDFVNNVAIASDEKDLIHKIVSDVSFDILLLDIEIGGIDIISLVKELFSANKKTKILTMTNNVGSGLIIELYDIGISGCILKDTNKDELLRALNSVKVNEQYYSQSIKEVLFKTLLTRDKINKSSRLKYKITPREIDILKLICQQYSSDEIAEKLYISVKTVKRHRQILFEKTKSKNLVGLVVFSIQNGYFTIYSDN